MLFYGWYIAFAGLISYALGYGARYSFSIIFPALLDEFKWPRDVTAAMLSWHLLTYGLTAPAAGHLVDRIGPRPTMVLGASLLSLGLALSKWANTPWHFYATFGVLAGAGLCMIGAVPFTTVARNWFERKRGLALSIIFFGSGGAFALYPPIAWLIHRVGWRNTFLVEAGVVAGILIPLFLWVVRYHPREKGLARDGIAADQNPSPAKSQRIMRVLDKKWAGTEWTIATAIRTRRYWLLSLAFFCFLGVSEHVMVTHHVAFAMDVGFTDLYASSVLSIFGIIFAFGALAGLISDRIGRELTMTLGVAASISGILVLMLIKDTSAPWMLYYYSISLGFGIGICAPTLAASMTDIFQGPKVGSVIGSIWLGFAMGGAIGPWLGGWLFELRGNYFLAFLIAIVLNAVACMAIWLAAPSKVRRLVKSGEIAMSEGTRDEKR